MSSQTTQAPNEVEYCTGPWNLIIPHLQSEVELQGSIDSYSFIASTQLPYGCKEVGEHQTALLGCTLGMTRVPERCEPVGVDKQKRRLVPAGHHRQSLCTSHDKLTALPVCYIPFARATMTHKVIFDGCGWVHEPALCFVHLPRRGLYLQQE